MNDEWQSGDPFVDSHDPEALAREQRRREREQRRRERREAEMEREPQPEPQAATQPEPEPNPGPEPEPERRPSPLPQTPRPSPSRPPRRQTIGSALSERFGAARRRASAWSADRRAARSGSRAQAPAATGASRDWLSSNGLRLGMLIAAALLLWFLYALFQPFHGDGSGKVLVQIPKGASVSEVGDVLDERGVVTSGALFQVRATLAGKRSELYPGNFTMAEGMSYGDAIDVLSTPPQKRTITALVPEGLSRGQIAPITADAGIAGSYLAASKQSKYINPARYGARKPSNLEGFLFPATYELPARGTAADLVQLQVQAFRDRIGEVDMGYARSKNLTTYDVLIIASMIEREVQVPRERKLVAAVIYNRLRDGQPLGIDATIRFAVGNYLQPLTNSQLATPSPYNTRINAGLPPGPIGNPGIDAIEAAAHPARVDYLFYVVKPGTCGEHSFSTSEADFLRDQAAYQRALEAQGGSPTEC